MSPLAESRAFGVAQRGAGRMRSAGHAWLRRHPPELLVVAGPAVAEGGSHGGHDVNPLPRPPRSHASRGNVWRTLCVPKRRSPPPPAPWNGTRSVPFPRRELVKTLGPPACPGCPGCPGCHAFAAFQTLIGHPGLVGRESMLAPRPCPWYSRPSHGVPGPESRNFGPQGLMLSRPISSWRRRPAAEWPRKHGTQPCHPNSDFFSGSERRNQATRPTRPQGKTKRSSHGGDGPAVSE
jgi:hypothetical protein